MQNISIFHKKENTFHFNPRTCFLYLFVLILKLCFSCVTDSELCTTEIRISSKTSISWSSQSSLDTNRKHIFSFGFFVMLCKWAVIRVRASNISEPLPGRLAQRSEAEPCLWCAVDVCKCTRNAQTIQSLAFLSGTHAQTWYLKFQQAYRS